jgi:excisionase family DNA binding protein
MSMTTSPISMQQAAELLGVHYMTVYRYVRLGMLPARKEGGTWRIDPADLELLDTAPEVPARRRSAPWQGRLMARLLAGDESGSWGVVEAALQSGMAPRDFYCEVLTPALHAIGERWAEGDLGIEDEHLASNVAARLIGRLGPRFARRGRPRGSVVLAMPPGERHGLGLAMLADVLRHDGYRVFNLGADTPAEALAAALAPLDDLVAVAIGVVGADRLGAATAMIRAVRQAAPAVPVVVGGAAITDAITAERMGADGFAESACRAGELIADLSR